MLATLKGATNENKRAHLMNLEWFEIRIIDKQKTTSAFLFDRITNISLLVVSILLGVTNKSKPTNNCFTPAKT